MNWVKGFALVTCLATPLSVIAAMDASAAPAGVSSTVDPIVKVAMTDDEKKAKATDCSKQADAKKLHGDARRKFRSACKKA